MEPKGKRLAKKLQSGAILNTGQKAYDSNFGKGLRSVLFGNDNELSDEEYLQKHGYAKPITGTVHLPMAPEEGPFMGVKYLTKGSFGTGARYNAGLERKLTEAAAKKSLTAYESMQKPLSAGEKFIQKPIEEQNRIVKFGNGEKYSGMVDLQRSEKGLAEFKRGLGKHKNGGILKAQEGTSFVNTMLYPGNQEIAFTEYYTPDKPIEFIQEIPESYIPQYNFDSKEESFVAAPLPEVTTTVQENPQEDVQETTPVTQRSTSTKYTDRNKFISDMTAAYAKALSKKGISTEYARRLAVQDALESNFGKSYAGNGNFGNIIVGSSGASYTEGNDTDGNGNPIKQKFRNYTSLEDFINHKIDLLNGRRYRAFDGDIEQFYDRVKAGGYATSKNYVSALNKLYEQYK